MRYAAGFPVGDGAPDPTLQRRPVGRLAEHAGHRLQRPRPGGVARPAGVAAGGGAHGAVPVRHRRGEAAAVARRMRQLYPQMATYTRDEFVSRTGWHWLTTTKAGIALGAAALLGFVVGAVITSQTLYAAVAAAIKEYAVLRALGIPR